LEYPNCIIIVMLLGSTGDFRHDTEKVLTSREIGQQKPSPNPDLFYRFSVSNYFRSCFL